MVVGTLRVPSTLHIVNGSRHTPCAVNLTPSPYSTHRHEKKLTSTTFLSIIQNNNFINHWKTPIQYIYKDEYEKFRCHSINYTNL